MKKNPDTKQSKLTDKQILFANEYIVDFNKTQAAIRAGYSRQTANKIGWENWTKPEIQELIAELIEERAQRTKITADMVVAEVAKLGFSNPKRYFNESGHIKPLHELSDDEAAAIMEVKTKEFVMMDGTSKIVETTFKMHSKTTALDMLMKHTGAYEKDNKQRPQGQVMFYLPENGRE
jgi:phage terminase small subunit